MKSCGQAINLTPPFLSQGNVFPTRSKRRGSKSTLSFGGRLIWLMRAGKPAYGFGLLGGFTYQQMILKTQTRVGNQ